MNDQLFDLHPSVRTEGADHDLPYHLPIRPVHLETEHVRGFIPVSEPEVEITDRLGVDEGHGDFADLLQIDTKVRESGGEEAGGSFRIESCVAHLVENGDGYGWITPQVESPCAVFTA